MGGVEYRRGFKSLLGFNVFAKIATPLIAILVARLVQPEILGAYALLVMVLTFVDLVRDAGIARLYLNEKKPDADLDKSYAGYATSVHIVLGLGIALAAVPFAAYMRSPQLAEGFYWIAGATVLNGMSTVPYARLHRAGRFRDVGMADTAGSVLSSIYALTLIYMGAGFWALASQQLVRSLIFLSITATRSWTTPSCRDIRRFGKFARESASLIGASILWVAYSVGDNLFVSRVLGVATGGFYATGKMMVSSADVLIKPVHQVALLGYSRAVGDDEAIAKVMYKCLLATLLAVVPVYVAVALFARPLVLFFLSEKYSGTIAALPPLCAYFAAVYPGNFAANALVTVGKSRVPFVAWIVGYAAMALALFTIRTDNLTTFAWLFAGGLIFVNSISLGSAVRRFPPSHDTMKNLMRAIGALVVTTVISFAASLLALPLIASVATVGLALPLAHLMVLGLMFNRRPLSLFGKPGLKALWHRI